MNRGRQTASVVWERNEHPFTDNRYSRRHGWRFDGGFEVPASASPEVVPSPMSDPMAVDPEEAFLAALSQCHMLWFLSIAAKRGFVIDRYHDDSEGVMSTDERRSGTRRSRRGRCFRDVLAGFSKVWDAPAKNATSLLADLDACRAVHAKDWNPTHE